MRHQVDGRKFGRNTSHRKAMFRNMANSVIAKEQIVTTVEKAKEIRRVVDRLITLAKKGDLASKRLAFDRTRDRASVTKLFGELTERYTARAGGYTRVLRLSDRRWGDAAEMAVVELVDHPTIDRKRKAKPQAEANKAGEDGETAKADAALPQDPFKRFRKMMGTAISKKTKGSTGAGKAGKSTKVAKKAPAAKGGKRSSAGE